MHFEYICTFFVQQKPKIAYRVLGKDFFSLRLVVTWLFWHESDIWFCIRYFYSILFHSPGFLCPQLHFIRCYITRFCVTNSTCTGKGQNRSKYFCVFVMLWCIVQGLHSPQVLWDREVPWVRSLHLQHKRGWQLPLWGPTRMATRTAVLRSHFR